MHQPEPFHRSAFVWLEDNAIPRNQYARFTLSFSHSGEGSLPIHLFADTRYRLRVNGQTVYVGPGRFVTQYPEYDTLELAPYCQEGENLVEVEVNHFGASSFQSMPDGKPGFIAAGGNQSVDFSTPGSWKAERLLNVDAHAPLYSFAQSPVEIRDTQRLGAQPRPIRVLPPEACPWGPLTPYSGIPLPLFVHRPATLEVAGPLLADEVRYGFMAFDPSSGRPETIEGHQKPWIGFATWILSPREQTVVASGFWGEHLLNGNPVKSEPSQDRGNHRQLTLPLRDGWNLLTGEVEVLTQYWGYLLGVPTSARLSLHARQDPSCREPIAISTVVPRTSLQVPHPGDDEPPAGWLRVDGDPRRVTPARMMGWDRVGADSVRKPPYPALPTHSVLRAEQATWAFGFAGEFHGHVVAEVEAPAGTTLDVATDDWQRPDGQADLYRSNPFTDAADRFILGGGRQTVELFHARGGKVVQLTLRAPDGPAELKVHDLWVRTRQVFQHDETRFDCDDEVLTWAWPVSMRTLVTSTDDAYADCPWRERGSYIGDGYVNLHLNLLLSPDRRPARRTLRSFAQAQLENGQLPGCAPAWLRATHEDFTLIWTLAARDYWAHTGDVAFLEEVWETLERIWTSPSWNQGPEGLWNLVGGRAFFDWGIVRSEREGIANAGLNILRYAALGATADIARALGHIEAAEAAEAERSDVHDAIRKVLWSHAEGRLLASQDASTPALHANVLALRFGWGSPEERQQILSYLEPHLLANLERGLAGGEGSGHLELYFLNYLLPALAELGRPDLAERILRDHYGYLMHVGDDTLPECFCRVEQGGGSRCHSWSGAAAIYATRYILGLQLARPGEPDRFLIQPVVAGISRASGRVAHPRGWIEVEWHRRNGEISLQVEVPNGVEVIKMPGPSSTRMSS